MKTTYTTVSTLLLLFLCVNHAYAQVRVGAWEIHEGNEGVIDFPTPDMAARVAAFSKAKIPAQSDPKWETAKTQADGTVDYPDLGEKVTKCAQQLDFTSEPGMTLNMRAFISAFTAIGLFVFKLNLHRVFRQG